MGKKRQIVENTWNDFWGGVLSVVRPTAALLSAPNTQKIFLRGAKYCEIKTRRHKP